MRSRLLHWRLGARTAEGSAPEPPQVDGLLIIPADQIDLALHDLTRAVPRVRYYDLRDGSALRQRSRLFDALRRIGFDVSRSVADSGLRIVGCAGDAHELTAAMRALEPHLVRTPTATVTLTGRIRQVPSGAELS